MSSEAENWVGPKPGPPTARDIEIFLAVVEHSTTKAAAQALGASLRTINIHLAVLYARIGALDRPHAAWLLYPVLGDRYVLPGDEPRLRVVA